MLKVRVLVALATILVASSASAQEEGGGDIGGGCGVMMICSGGHKVSGPAGGGVYYPHMDCVTCLTQGGCHPGCDQTLGDFKGKYREILNAANDGDVGAILRVGATAGGYVTFNAARQSLQILSCNKAAVVANLPLRSAADIALARRLSGPPALNALSAVAETAPRLP